MTDKEDSGLNRTYNGVLTELPPNGVFVFGSNTQGRHGKGAAYSARIHFGAQYGQAAGLQGRSYAIITKDLTKVAHPSIPEGQIIQSIKRLYNEAINTPDKDYYIAYAGGSRNLNGYTDVHMAQIFAQAAKGAAIPTNIVFEQGFYQLVKRYYLHINQNG